MIAVLHHNDLDGRCAAALVRLFSTGNTCFIKMTYEDELDTKALRDAQTVFVVDFSLGKPGDWEKLIEAVPEVIWIDHHKTAIERPGPQQELKGLRSTTGGSAALLTYSYLTGDNDVPRALRLISDFDTWAWEKKNDQEPVNFMYGMKGEDDSPGSLLWGSLLMGSSMNHVIDRIIETGKKVRAAYDSDNAEFIKQYGFAAEIDGHGVAAVNRGKQGSLVFGDLQKKFDITSTFVYDALAGHWVVSLYSLNPSVDVSAIAKRFGGGGHRGASGFTCDELPFINRRAL